MHDRLKEVIVDPHLIIELIDSQHVGDGVEAFIAQISPDQGGVLLFDARIVILVVGAAAREGHALDALAPEAKHMMIEELTPVVGVNLLDGEG
jgi:hypothetical protein